MKKPQQEALEICQEIGRSTMFTDCNNAMSLPLHISQKVAKEFVTRILKLNIDEKTTFHYEQVYKEIDLI